MLVRTAAPVEAVAGKHDDSIVYYLIRNRQLARSYIYPTDAGSALQNTLRGYFASISAAWKNVSDANAAAWETLAEAMGGTDSLGRAYGFYVNNAYMSVNLYRLIDGQTITDSAPAYDPPPAPIELNGVATIDGGATLNIEISHTNAAGVLFFVQVTPPMPSQRRRARTNELRIPTTNLADSVIVRSASPQTLSVTTQRIGIPASGPTYVGIRIRALSENYLPGGELFIPSAEVVYV